MEQARTGAEAGDHDLWARALAGSGHHFGLIWDRYRLRVFHQLTYLGNSGAEAEDLTAVVFLELWRHRRAVTLPEQGSLLPWLLATARNVHRNASRSRRRYRAALVRLPIPSASPDPAIEVAEGSAAAHQLAAVREHLRKHASPQERALVELVAAGGTTRQAAELLGTSEAAAKMRLSRLRRKLRQAVRALETSKGDVL